MRLKVESVTAGMYVLVVKYDWVITGDTTEYFFHYNSRTSSLFSDLEMLIGIMNNNESILSSYDDLMLYSSRRSSLLDNGTTISPPDRANRLHALLKMKPGYCSEYGPMPVTIEQFKVMFDPLDVPPAKYKPVQIEIYNNDAGYWSEFHIFHRNMMPYEN